MPAFRASTITSVLLAIVALSGCHSSDTFPGPTAPSGLTYSVNPAVYAVGIVIPSNTPSSIGGAVVTYSVSPALPAGLGLDSSTGVISGTPTEVTPATAYVVTATNAEGSATTGLSITVDTGVSPPGGLTYSVNPAVYTVGAAVSSNTPSSSGGAVVTYSVSPALPAGLSLDSSTGVISGTPTSVTPATAYVVTATNSGGSATSGLSITVNTEVTPPSGLTYSVNPAVYTAGTAISTNTPRSSGGAVATYSVSPALPAGLSLNTSTGVISGMPTTVTPATAYVVTATNVAGSTTAGLSITVNTGVISPSGLTYSVNPAVYTAGTAISTNTPGSSGGAVATYSVSPALPAGLSHNTATGGISGTPTAVIPATAYVVTATNVAGSTTAGLSIVVNTGVISPSGLTYSVNPAVYTAGTAISTNTPSSSGGAVATYSVSPVLPAGLSLNTATGVISGTPTTVTPAAAYVVTATNVAGSATTGLSITVNTGVISPSGLTYSVNPAVYTAGTAISANTPSSSGGAVATYSVSPALPAGLSLNTATGVISGTPTTVTPATAYVVTATNVAGSTTAGLSITVNTGVIPPSGLRYSVNPAVYSIGIAISSNTPSSSGGAVVTYSVSPALPAGLSLNTSTGVISGTPTAATPNAAYVVTATNVAGSTVAALSITVNGMVASFQIVPYPGSYGVTGPGVLEPVGQSSAFIINALDSNGNVLDFGSAPPTFTVALSTPGSPNPLSVVEPTVGRPYVFSINASSFDGVAQMLTVVMAPCTTVCAQVFTVHPQEIVAMDALAPNSSIEFRAYPDLSISLPSLPASSASQGLVADTAGNIYFFDANNELAVSAPPYTSSTPLQAGYTSTNNTRLVYEPTTGNLEINDPTELLVSPPSYTSVFSAFGIFSNISVGATPTRSAALVGDGMTGESAGKFSSFSGNGNNTFDAIYCPSGFGTDNTSDAILMTYNGAGSPSIGVIWVNPSAQGPVVAFPNGTAIAQQAYQVACDSNGYVTVWYDGSLNRFAPSATAPTSSVTAALPYAQPYGLVTDAVGNVFYAQVDGLIAWDGTSAVADSVTLPFTPGNVAIIP